MAAFDPRYPRPFRAVIGINFCFSTLLLPSAQPEQRQCIGLATIRRFSLSYYSPRSDEAPPSSLCRPYQSLLGSVVRHCCTAVYFPQYRYSERSTENPISLPPQTPTCTAAMQMILSSYLHRGLILIPVAAGIWVMKLYALSRRAYARVRRLSSHLRGGTS
jgi:hypothetical protein